MRVISNMTQLDTLHVSKICGVIGWLQTNILVGQF